MLEQHKNKHLIFSFFGPPGSGKGTLARKIRKDLGFDILSTGDLCRKHVAMQTELGKVAAKCLAEGNLVPDDLINQMVSVWLIDTASRGSSIILDGYPRTDVQAEALQKILEDVVENYSFTTVFFDITEAEVVKRLTSRLVCENKTCQAIYSPIISPQEEGICDSCGSILIRRNDDKPEVIHERLAFYPDYKKKLFSFYKRNNLQIEEFDVTNLTPEEVYNLFKKLVEKLSVHTGK